MDNWIKFLILAVGIFLISKSLSAITWAVERIDFPPLPAMIIGVVFFGVIGWVLYDDFIKNK